MLFPRNCGVLFLGLMLLSAQHLFAQSDFNQLNIDIYQGTNTEYSDNVVCNSILGSSTGIDNDDLPKAFGSFLAVSINGNNYSIETHPLVNCRDSFQLNLITTTQGNYRFVVDMSAYPAAPGLTAVLKDMFLNTTRALKFEDTTQVSFSITSNAATRGLRFRIVFTRSLVQTDPFTQLPPVCRGEVIDLPTTSSNGVTGTWSPAVNNTQTTTYTFNASEGQCATSPTMTVTVNQPVTPLFDQIGPFTSGTNFTLPAVSNNGITGSWSPAINNTETTSYTFTPDAGQCANTAQVTVAINFPTSIFDWNLDKGYKIYPNPIAKKGTVQLAFQNKATGLYMVSLINLAGVRIQQKMVSHAGGSAVHALNLDSRIGSGLYLMEIINQKGEMEWVKMAVQ